MICRRITALAERSRKNNAAALDAGATRTRIPSFRDLVDSGDLGLTGAGKGHFELTGKPRAQITALTENPQEPVAASAGRDGPQHEAAASDASREEGEHVSAPERDREPGEQVPKLPRVQRTERAPTGRDQLRNRRAAQLTGPRARATGPASETSTAQSDHGAPSGRSGVDQPRQHWPESVPLDGLDRAEDVVRELNPSRASDSGKQ